MKFKCVYHGAMVKILERLKEITYKEVFEITKKLVGAHQEIEFYPTLNRKSSFGYLRNRE